DDNRGILSDLLWPLHHSHHAHGLPRHPACLAPLVILQIHVWRQQARWQQVRKRQARQREAAQGGVHTTPV
ncbi:unnamed protein product, partial [Closterium sp. NIES-54]